MFLFFFFSLKFDTRKTKEGDKTQEILSTIKIYISKKNIILKSC